MSRRARGSSALGAATLLLTLAGTWKVSEGTADPGLDAVVAVGAMRFEYLTMGRVPSCSQGSSCM